MKWAMIILGLFVVFLGLLPLLSGFLPILDFIPSEGLSYNLLIALAGGLIVYLSYEKKSKEVVLK